MITIHIWLLAIPTAVIVVLAAGLLYVLVHTQDIADRRLERELYQSPVNPQKAQDREDPQ